MIEELGIRQSMSFLAIQRVQPSAAAELKEKAKATKRQYLLCLIGNPILLNYAPKLIVSL